LEKLEAFSDQLVAAIAVAKDAVLTGPFDDPVAPEEVTRLERKVNRSMRELVRLKGRLQTLAARAADAG
jgi:hypothetical protein